MSKILIIDDEAPARIAVRKLGCWEKYDVHDFYEETNGADGLKTLREVQPALIFVDMQMPTMNGIEFLQKASVEYPEGKYIVISGFDRFEYAQQALKCGATDYLLKPIARDDLNHAIEHAFSLLGTKENSSRRYTPEEAVSAIKDDIDQHYSRAVKISDYASRYYFTQEYLTRQFRSRFDCTIQEYLLKVRMERAEALLKDPSIKIQEIASRVGYADNNYFSKAFKAWSGMSPTEYRIPNHQRS